LQERGILSFYWNKKRTTLFVVVGFFCQLKQRYRNQYFFSLFAGRLFDYISKRGGKEQLQRQKTKCRLHLLILSHGAYIIHLKMPKFQWPESEDHLGEWHVTIAGLRLVQQSEQQ